MHRRWPAVALALALSASACVRDKSPEPGVRAITTDLQYKQLQQTSAAPPNTVPVAQPEAPVTAPPPAPGRPSSAPAPSTGPIATLPPFDLGPVGPVQPPKPAVCPTAAPTEQAQEDVTPKVSRMPQAGEYLWKVSGREIVGGQKLPLPTYTKRKVSDVHGSVSGGKAELSFVTEERELSATNPNAPVVKSFFDVTDKTTTDNAVRGGGTDPKLSGVNSGRTGTAGVRLVKVIRTSGNTTTAFIPSQPIRYLVTPVALGEERFWQDNVVDTSGSEPQTLVHRAYTEGRITIDACGKRIRGWKVIADQTYSRGGEKVTRHFEYAVATQLGGIVIFEHVESPCTKDSDTQKCAEGEPVLRFDAFFGKATG